ncbi:hypothetical protein COC42_10930 [Sphingomonas spermidinifaciens]|uniref:Glycerophosphoryl diester phosphodiesterase membrane domain-containing protein n=1 Tax=Sphingomonas spermidinifaciens TaxID=1141889 RepID=A0A2A4B1S3_9SPHN|nr:hypothetical protein [Sphingomonas spermidinifaciens]PCD01997.1 hypothetical protein COC42_10930 [Sphingomonas spermidinifaciens]
MKLNLGRVFAAAGALWRAERGLIVPLAGLFYFVPTLALLLFLPAAEPVAGGGDEAALDALLAYARDNAGAILSVNFLQLAASALLLSLFLAPGRPTLAEAARLAAGRLILFVAAGLLMWGALMLGAFLILPALYLIGRFFLVTAVLAAEPRTGPVQAIARSFALTAGRGWWCFVATAIPFFAGQAATTIASGMGQAIGSAGGVALALPFDALAAAATTAGWVLTMLVKIVVYRALTKGT